MTSEAGNAQLRLRKAQVHLPPVPEGSPSHSVPSVWVVAWTFTTNCSKAECGNEHFASSFLLLFPLLKGLSVTWAKAVRLVNQHILYTLLKSAKQHSIPDGSKRVKSSWEGMVGRALWQVRHDPCPCSGHRRDWVWFWPLAEPCSLQERGSLLLAAGAFLSCKDFLGHYYIQEQKPEKCSLAWR